jgi:hypothetical protein
VLMGLVRRVLTPANCARKARFTIMTPQLVRRIHVSHVQQVKPARLGQSVLTTELTKSSALNRTIFSSSSLAAQTTCETLPLHNQRGEKAAFQNHIASLTHVSVAFQALFWIPQRTLVEPAKQVWHSSTGVVRRATKAPLQQSGST